jgi:outer membrane immunogenic protein
LDRSLLGAAAFAVAISAGPVLASDLPSRKEPPPPPYFAPAPVANWSGFYFGVNAGGTFGGGDSISAATGALSPNVDAAAIAATGSGTGANNFGGFVGGGEIGYNWQLAPTIVAGAEVDIQGVAGRSGESSFWSASPGSINPSHTFGGAVSASQNLDSLGTVRGRIGYLATPSLLIYATGGLAYGGAHLSSSFVGTETDGVGAQAGGEFSGVAASGARVGWTAGGGLEWMFARNWSAKVEYLYYDLGSVSVGGPVLLYNPATFGMGLGASQTSAQFNGHIVRAGLNYHFHGAAPGPIVANY